MMREDHSRDGRKSCALMVGTAVGALAGLGWLRRWWTRRRSPLIRSGERLTALITGASSGIGRVYASKLADLGYDLILVARRRARLETLAAQLSTVHGVDVTVLVADLATQAGIERVEEVIAMTDDLNLLVNNAGYGLVGRFTESDVEDQEEMIRVHVLAAVRLTRAALPVMLSQGRGAIVNVASMSAFFPLPGGVTYGATKSYLKAFSEGLHQELVGTGVRVQSLCPGFTRTEFHATAGMDTANWPALMWTTSDIVVERSLRDLRNDRVVSIPGSGYRLLGFLDRLLPRRVIYVGGRLLAGERT